MAAQIAYIQGSKLIGAFLFQSDLIEVTRERLSFFRPKSDDLNEPAVLHPPTQRIQFDYPIMVYKGFALDNRELVMVNLADETNPQTIIHLTHLQFICFVGHDHTDREAKIGFLAFSGDKEIRLCWLHASRPFQRRYADDYEDYYLQDIPIKFNAPVLDQPSSIIRVEFVAEEDGGDDQKGGLFIQTERAIYFSNNFTGRCQRKSELDLMAPVTMQRGYNDQFYYAEYVAGKSGQKVYEVRAKLISGLWEITKHEIFKINEGYVLALEMDAENISECDSVYTEGRELRNVDVLNRLYIVDDKANLNLLAQDYAEPGQTYTVVQTRKLKALKKFSLELAEYKRKHFNSMSITSRCLTINETNYNFTNGHRWNLNIKTTELAEVDLVEVDEEEISIQSSDSDSEEVSDDNSKHDWLYQVHSVTIMPRNYKQVIVATIQHRNTDDSFTSKKIIITKPLPGCRSNGMLGIKGCRDLESINMISDEQYLMKFRATEFSGKKDYWTIMDRLGRIQRIPKLLKPFLTWNSFTQGASRLTEHGAVLSFRGGKKGVLSMYTDATIDDKRIMSVEFNRNGEVSRAKSYESNDYEITLKQQLMKDLLAEGNWLINDKHKYDEKAAEKCVASFSFTEDLIRSREGKLYRIATILDRNFKEDVTIDPLFKGDDLDEQMKEDSLMAGLYSVPNIEKRHSKNSTLREEVDDLNIVILLARHTKDVEHIHKAGFVICGNYLCYQFQDTPIVNVIPLDEIQSKNPVDADDDPFASIAVLNNKLLSQLPDAEDQFHLRTNTDFNVSRLLEVSTLQESASEIMGPRPVGSKLKKRNNHSDINESSEYDESYRDESEKNNSPKGELMSQGSSQDTPRGFVSHGLFMTTHFGNDQNDLLNNSSIDWRVRKSRTINLVVMMDNPDQDTKQTQLSDVPSSTQLSVLWYNKDRTKRLSKPTSVDCTPELNPNLLQITISNQIIVFDLSEKVPREIFYLNATHQFMDPECYVESGILMSKNYEDPSKRRDGYLMNSIIANRDRSQFYLRQDRLLYGEVKNVATIRKTSPCRAIFQTHCEVDISELKRISDILVHKKKLNDIDLQAALSIFQGHTLFSIFEQEVKMLEKLLEQLQEGEWEYEILEDEQEIQHNVLRRLYRILNLPTPKMDGGRDQNLSKSQLAQSMHTTENDEDAYAKKKNAEAEEQQGKESVVYNIESVLLGGLSNESARVRDLHMSIANRCDECQLSAFALNLEDMQVMIESVSQNFIELANESFIETPFTRKITNTDWYSESHMVTFRKSSSLITETECEEKVRRSFAENFGASENELSKTQVDVTMLNIDWMLADLTNFVDFVRVLKTSSSEQVYQLEIITVLLNEFWEENFKKIFWKVLMPWAVFMLCCTWYFMTILVDGYQDDPDLEESIYQYVLTATIFLLLIYQIWIEYIETQGTLLKYFSVPSNYADIFTFSSTAMIIIIQTFGLGGPSLLEQRLLAAFIILALWFKVFDWMRLFEQTSFYIRLIIETFVDIGYFMIIFFVALTANGCAMYMLQLNQLGGQPDIVEAVFGHFVVDSIYNQYMMSLGESATEGFDDHPEMLACYALWLAAVFITQLTFLNMLIALMGDTFGRVIESKAQYALQTKLGIMGDYTAVINRGKNVVDDEHYLFVIRPKSEGSAEDSAWEGGLGHIKKSVDTALATMQTRLVKEMGKVLNQGLEAKVRDSGTEREIRESYERLAGRFDDVKRQVNQSETRLLTNIDKNQELMLHQNKHKLPEANTQLLPQKSQEAVPMATEAREMAHILFKLESIAKKVDVDGTGQVAAQSETDVVASDMGSVKLQNVIQAVQSLKIHQKLTLSSLQGLKTQMQENERRIVEVSQSISSQFDVMGGDIKQALLRQLQQQDRQRQRQQ